MTARKPAAKKTPAKKAAPRKAAAKKPAARKRAPAKPPAPRNPTVAAVQTDIKALAKLAPELAQSAFAATALAMAREIDNGANSATSKANCARVLNESMTKLNELAPEKKEADRLDDLTSRHTARRAGT